MSLSVKEERRAKALTAAAIIEASMETDGWDEFYERANDFVRYIETGKTPKTASRDD